MVIGAKGNSRSREARNMMTVTTLSACLKCNCCLLITRYLFLGFCLAQKLTKCSKCWIYIVLKKVLKGSLLMCTTFTFLGALAWFSGKPLKKHLRWESGLVKSINVSQFPSILSRLFLASGLAQSRAIISHTNVSLF